MKKSLLISAAALLIAGPAFAQSMQGGASPAPERAQGAQPGAQQSAPATTGQSQPKSAPDSAQVPIGSSRAADDPKGPRQSQETTGQGSRSETTGQGTPSANPPVRDVTPKAESPSGKSDSGKSESSKSGTTGQGAASTSASLTGEQKTKISASLKQQNAPRVSKVNFNISIGTAIPRDLRRAPLPVTVIEVYPVWRGYEYVVVGDEILVIDPATLRIVAILDA